MTPNAERAAVAREVLAELLGYDLARVETIRDVQQFMDEHYPAPPAPETVTVGAVNTLRTGTANTLAVTVDRRVWTYDSEDECWDGPDGRLVFSDDPSSGFLHRIASDARVIADLQERAESAEWVRDELRRTLGRIGVRLGLGDMLGWHHDNAELAIAKKIAERDARIAELERQIGVIAGDCVAAQNARRQALADLQLVKAERDDARDLVKRTDEYWTRTNLSYAKERDAALADKEAARHNSRMNHERIAEVVVERDAANARIAELGRERDDAKAHAQADAKAWTDCMTELKATRTERDAALRALREKGQQERLAAVAPSPKASGDTQGSPPAPVVPAPIPLGAVVEVEGDRISPFTRCNGYWRDRSGNTWADDGGLGFMLAALYHARHPVATRETVERVRKALFQAFRETRVGEDFTENCTRAALSAAGFQEAGDGTP